MRAGLEAVSDASYDHDRWKKAFLPLDGVVPTIGGYAIP
jgi:hypothetical protein